MADDDQSRRDFADKVRHLYLEHFGEDAYKGLDGGEPVALGSVLLQIEAQYLDGETSMITLYDGSLSTCIGMAYRFANERHRDDD